MQPVVDGLYGSWRPAAGGRDESTSQHGSYLLQSSCQLPTKTSLWWP